MVRTAHALLLIASLLACPFRCAGVTGADAALTSSCSCCASHGEIPSLPATDPIQQDQQPSAPSDECQCGDCLCEGAVLTDDDPIQDAVVAGLSIGDG